ncbi:MAG: PRD domain-containing protein, partial [Erysipelotrichaceae bacterium]|nr:PRD domain-containing protein [Erysipelotrichaceae bacterium]
MPDHTWVMWFVILDSRFCRRFLSDQLNLQRSNVSSILNKLVEEGKLKKTNGRPVMFCLSEEMMANISQMFFQDLIGHQDSLMEVLQRTQAAILYPNQIPRVLFISEEGVGIRTIAQKVYGFAQSKRILPRSGKFVSLNCSHFDEKELHEKLLSQSGLIKEGAGGLILLRNADHLPASLIFEGVRWVQQHPEEHFILLIHMQKTNPLLKEYFNFILEMPSLKERTIQERFLFVEKFFREESKRIGKRIEVNYGMMQCLLVCPCQKNLLDLQKDIQYAAANASARTRGSRNVVIGLEDFLPDVRKGLLYIKENAWQIDQVLRRNMNYVFSSSETFHVQNRKPGRDIYAQIDYDLLLLGPSARMKDANDYAFANMDANLLDYMNQITDGMTEEKLRKTVSPKLLSLVEQFFLEAAERFSKVYSNRIYYGLSLHLNNAIVNHTQKQRISNEKIMQMIENCPEEYLFARQFMKKVEDAFSVQFSLDETIFAALLLMAEETGVQKQPEVIALIAMHGRNTASSMAEVIQKLMPLQNVEAFDLSLEEDVLVSYEQLKQKILSIHQGKGILLFYDMGSIQVMAHS